MKILGIDPSLRYTGIVIINNNKIDKSFLIYSTKKADASGCKLIHVDDIYIGLDKHLTEIVNKYKPEVTGVEIPFIPRNMGHLNKILILCGWIQHIIFSKSTSVTAMLNVSISDIRNYLGVYKRYKDITMEKINKIIPNIKWKGKDIEHLYDATAVALTAKNMILTKEEE